MTDVFDYVAGTTPLIVSIPHDGRQIPKTQLSDMTEAGAAIPDTDWHVRQLYDFASSIGASVLSANYSRYVVDLNRSAQDENLYPGQTVTGLCPRQTFRGEDIYLHDKQPDTAATDDRIIHYWRPYHDKLQELVHNTHKRFGVALLWDAHSIPSQVPRLFDGILPDLNFGTNDGLSCAADIVENLVSTAERNSDYSVVYNGRFKGGYITRNYGRPADGVHAVQLELTQSNYMNETTLAYDLTDAARLKALLQQILVAFTDWGIAAANVDFDA